MVGRNPSFPIWREWVCNSGAVVDLALEVESFQFPIWREWVCNTIGYKLVRKVTGFQFPIWREWVCNLARGVADLREGVETFSSLSSGSRSATSRKKWGSDT